MTPYTHHISDNYLDAYMSELNRDLAEANRRDTFSPSISERVARTLVRVGAWMLRDKPEFVSDTILVLPKQQDTSTIRKAA